MIKIPSPVFGEGERIPAKYTCDGANVNPPLDISGVPKAAKYGGPCPPSDTHRYFFKIQALDVNGRVIDTAQLIGKYSHH